VSFVVWDFVVYGGNIEMEKLPLPRGIGLDVSGMVDAIGEGVTDVAIGDAILGAADFMSGSSAGASDQTIMYYWFRMGFPNAS
jgi:NADPH:quinone reductase-like Zn-dependent oxidoreductase